MYPSVDFIIALFETGSEAYETECRNPADHTELSHTPSREQRGRRAIWRGELAWSLRTLQYGDGDIWIREYRPALEAGIYGGGRYALPQGTLYWFAGPELVALTGEVTQEGSSGGVVAHKPYTDVYLDLNLAAGYELPGGFAVGLRGGFEAIPYSDLTLTFIATLGVEVSRRF